MDLPSIACKLSLNCVCVHFDRASWVRVVLKRYFASRSLLESSPWAEWDLADDEEDGATAAAAFSSLQGVLDETFTLDWKRINQHLRSFRVARRWRFASWRGRIGTVSPEHRRWWRCLWRCRWLWKDTTPRWCWRAGMGRCQGLGLVLLLALLLLLLKQLLLLCFVLTSRENKKSLRNASFFVVTWDCCRWISCSDVFGVALAVFHGTACCWDVGRDLG